jgi:thermitase
MALTDAKTTGMAIVASVGNDATSDSNYPAGYPSVIGVAATDFNDRLATFSNYGKSVSITAPGAYVVSTVPGGKYAAAWGTSFSAPIVSGAIALAVSLRPNGQAGGMMAVNMADAIDSLNPGFENKLGRGRLNIQRTLKK